MSDASPTSPSTARSAAPPSLGALGPKGVPTVLAREARSSGLTRDALRRLRRNPGAVAGLFVLLAMVGSAALAPLIAPYDPIAQDSQAIRAAPSMSHLFGADSFGRDVFSRVLYGGRLSLPVGLVAVGIAALIGVAFGLISGYYGGLVDTAVMRAVDLMLAFPGILLAMSLVAILGTSLFNLMLAVGIASIPEYTRVVRASVLSAREAEYVTAARVSGARDRTMMFRHILPNILPPIIVLMTLGIAGAIILGSTLSFLGLGVKPPKPEWGNMLSDGRAMMRHFWWVSFFPGLAIMVTVLSINLLGDGLRDALDPRQRNR
ncbi:MAG: ABC transporter permease [Thermomicrobiales bacterium]